MSAYPVPKVSFIFNKNSSIRLCINYLALSNGIKHFYEIYEITGFCFNHLPCIECLDIALITAVLVERSFLREKFPQREVSQPILLTGSQGHSLSIIFPALLVSKRETVWSVPVMLFHLLLGSCWSFVSRYTTGSHARINIVVPCHLYLVATWEMELLLHTRCYHDSLNMLPLWSFPPFSGFLWLSSQNFVIVHWTAEFSLILYKYEM